MIIDCPCGKKKFNVKDELIPAKGRLLQCGDCDREWFFSKDINTIEENNVEKFDEEIAQESFGIIDDKYDDEVYEEDKKEETTGEVERPEKIKKQKTKQVSFFKILLVFIISFVAFILIVDTFIVQISEYVPFAGIYLDNLYQSIIDISLFFQNLIK
ncbi:MAG: zinc-ribbon domain-containing protein [Candidatus Pelagibacter sp.]